MKKVTTILCLLSILVSNAQEMTVSTGKLKHFEQFKSDYVESRNIDVWLPDGYSELEKYAVLYMHDGQMLFDANTTWNKNEWMADEVAGKLIADGKTKKFIIVGIASLYKIRHSDLFPQKPFESLPKKQQDSLYALGRNSEQALFGSKVNSDNYLKFIVKELKPFIDKNFSVKKDRANTFVAGSSMGGLISLYAICEYPEVFGGAACISTHWPGVFNTDKNPIPEAFLQYMKQHLPKPETHKIYFDYGDQTLDALYEPFQKRADAIMKDKGFTAKNWMTKAFPGADHSEESWQKRLDVPFLFLLEK